MKGLGGWLGNPPVDPTPPTTSTLASDPDTPELGPTPTAVLSRVETRNDSSEPAGAASTVDPPVTSDRPRGGETPWSTTGVRQDLTQVQRDRVRHPHGVAEQLARGIQAQLVGVSQGAFLIVLDQVETARLPFPKRLSSPSA